ncbi:MAG TPA: DUF4215 domain-containing protein [Polyangiales bacterium]
MSSLPRRHDLSTLAMHVFVWAAASLHAGCSEPDQPDPMPEPPPPAVAIPKSICGNGVVEQAEVCDDRNQLEDDYCAADCSRVTGSCGDGIWQSFETCEGAQGYFGVCTERCSPRIDSECFSRSERCQPKQLTGLPHAARVADLDVSQTQAICRWLNRLKGEIMDTLGSSYTLCSGFKFTYDQEDCTRVAHDGKTLLAKLPGLETCDLTVLEYERCQLDTISRPCATLRLDGSKVRLTSPCWTQACQGTYPSPGADAGADLDAAATQDATSADGAAAADAGRPPDADDAMTQPDALSFSLDVGAR